MAFNLFMFYKKRNFTPTKLAKLLIYPFFFMIFSDNDETWKLK